MSMPLPRYYDGNDVGKLFLERGGMIADEAIRFSREYNIKPADQDTFRIAAFGIDCQVGFCLPGASLFVPGAVEDTRRTIEWLYRNLDRITGLYFSLDTHRVYQIFHPAWWTDREGRHPAPLTSITFDDVRTGRWIPCAQTEAALEYTRKLESGGRYVLTIWPYHTLLGGVSHALVPSLMEASIFHDIARRHQTHFETKGSNALTENYSVLSPEVQTLGGEVIGRFNAPLFDMLMEFDRVYIFGQAKSHCVLSTLRDLRDHILANDPSMLDKIWILEDAMSPVPAPPLDPLPPALNFPLIASQAFEELGRAGMHIVTTADPIS